MSYPRERILDTAAVLFHQQGYNSTGINQIIQEANVAKASFYQHFKSKDELCIAFLQQRHLYWFEQLKSFSQPGNSPKEQVLLAFDFLIAMNAKENFRGCSFLNILSEISREQESILFVIQVHKRELRHFFKAIITEELLSTQIYLLFESAIIESQLFKSDELIHESKSIINNLL